MAKQHLKRKSSTETTTSPAPKSYVKRVRGVRAETWNERVTRRDELQANAEKTGNKFVWHDEAESKHKKNVLKSAVLDPKAWIAVMRFVSRKRTNQGKAWGWAAAWGTTVGGRICEWRIKRKNIRPASAILPRHIEIEQTKEHGRLRRVVLSDNNWLAIEWMLALPRVWWTDEWGMPRPELPGDFLMPATKNTDAAQQFWHEVATDDHWGGELNQKDGALSSHSFRKIMITWLLFYANRERDVPMTLTEVNKWIDHAYVSTTQGYNSPTLSMQDWTMNGKPRQYMPDTMLMFAHLVWQQLQTNTWTHIVKKFNIKEPPALPPAHALLLKPP